MPVRLDQIPSPAPRPAPPRIWFWVCLLPLLLLLGMGETLLFASEPLNAQSIDSWQRALGVPLFVWCVLLFGRLLLYFGQQGASDGWDEARDEDFCRKMRRGRRSQQVLSANLFTALRNPGEEGATQLDALLSGTEVLTAQPTRLDEIVVRHSRLSGEKHEDLEKVLLNIFSQVLVELAQTLAQLPDEKPLALLLEVESGLPQSQWRPAWHTAWNASGIRQSVVPVEGQGLSAVDQWLDQRIDDQALLLVVALQFAPLQPEGKAEAAVGLLLGNRLTQTTLPPMAYLHRPEQGRAHTPDALLYATRQALDWVPMDAKSIEHAWRAGVDGQRNATISTVLTEVPMPVKYPQGLIDLDASLGHPGTASPWLAIAVATQTIQRGAGPQFIFSGDSVADAGLWSTVLTPVLPLSTKES
ncbi:MAG: hypothetical protein IV106_02705 [Pseudomonas umsongensis]|jgi:hypothetical protein|uniref:Uncharacterized protein n=1 Tax=Pseudomonas umsongensis TaxID=198618 RepID=A0AAE7DD81_9PSED|nr:hypothetical protein [Pseudomonas umsongensis]QJC78118.1 hypothetical protein HGP31_07300 [Pseudomonas umsongensis]